MLSKFLAPKKAGNSVYFTRTESRACHFFLDLPRRLYFILFPFCNVRPWPNGVASRRKLKTWVYCNPVWPGLACTCNKLRPLSSRSNLHANRCKFFTVWPPSPSQRKLSDVHWHIISQYRICLPWNVFFFDLRVLVRKFASPFGHPTQVLTQVQLAATCDYLRLCLAKV